MGMTFDAVQRTYDPTQIKPQFNPDLQPRFSVKLKASTFYPAGSLIGETTANAGVFGLTITISNVALTSNVATITTKGKHGLSVGDSVVVTAVTATTVNGTVTVASVPSATTFTYAKTASDVSSAADTGTVVRDTGTASPKAVIPFDCTTDSNGVIYAGQQTGGEFGEFEVQGVFAYFGGVYKSSDIPNLDQVALTALGGKILFGKLSDSTAFISF